MRIKWRFGILIFGLMALLVPAGVALAKGPADKITIQGPGLASPIEVLDPQALQEFSPWSDQFMDLTQRPAAPPSTATTYSITLIVKPQWTYGFDYVPDPSGGRGYIYLPGPGDNRYRRNMGTIIRNEDGQWLYASKDWDALMQRVLPRPAASRVADSPNVMPESGGSPQPSPLWLVPLGAALLIVGSAAIYAHRGSPPRKS